MSSVGFTSTSSPGSCRLTRSCTALSKRDHEPSQEVVNDPDTFEGEIETMIANTLAANPGSFVGTTKRVVNNQTINTVNGTMALVQLSAADQLISDDWLRVFHPNPSGHAIIANLVCYYMALDRAKTMNALMGPELVPAPASCAYNNGDPVKMSDGLGLVVYEHSIFPVSFRLDLIGPSSGDAPSIYLNSSSPTFLGDQIPYLFHI